MSYKCEVCRAISPPKARRHVWRVYAPAAGEMPVCLTCLSRLEAGEDIGDLIREYAADQSAPEYITLRGSPKAGMSPATVDPTELLALQQNAQAIKDRKNPPPPTVKRKPSKRRKIVTPNVTGYPFHFGKPMTAEKGWNSPFKQGA